MLRKHGGIEGKKRRIICNSRAAAQLLKVLSKEIKNFFLHFKTKLVLSYLIDVDALIFFAQFVLELIN
jgi:6-phosphogluconate dehydrogenase